jgi:hypothetical protein
MAGTCSLVASWTARAAASPPPLSLRPSGPVMSELRESLEPSGRAGKLGVDAPLMGADVSASQLFPEGSGGLVLPGNRSDLIESDAFFAITSDARWRRPFGLADPRPANGSMVFSWAALTLCPLTAFLLFFHRCIGSCDS